MWLMVLMACEERSETGESAVVAWGMESFPCGEVGQDDFWATVILEKEPLIYQFDLCDDINGNCSTLNYEPQPKEGAVWEVNCGGEWPDYSVRVRWIDPR